MDLRLLHTWDWKSDGHIHGQVAAYYNMGLGFWGCFNTFEFFTICLFWGDLPFHLLMPCFPNKLVTFLRPKTPPLKFLYPLRPTQSLAFGQVCRRYFCDCCLKNLHKEHTTHPDTEGKWSAFLVSWHCASSSVQVIKDYPHFTLDALWTL